MKVSLKKQHKSSKRNSVFKDKIYFSPPEALEGPLKSETVVIPAAEI